MQAEGDSFDSIFQSEDIEVYQQSDLKPGEFEIGKKLGVVDRKQRFYRFDLDDHDTRNEQIQPVAAVQVNALITNRQRFLLFDTQAPFSQFEDKTRFVCGFEKTRPKFTMNAHGAADDLPGQIVYLQMFAIQCIGLAQRAGPMAWPLASRPPPGSERPNLQLYLCALCDLCGEIVFQPTCL